ncbi:hypothetical protein AB0F46_04505 [Streptomyces sp. NPDC026665]|uniref:hypothetical protein n=1 Tax=Streptomyces sp. NPDC026665 TaxID=3154798 RepID=UPI0033EEC78A
MDSSDWIALCSAAIAAASLAYTRTQAKAAKKANVTATAANSIALDANGVSAEANETAKQALALARAQFHADQQAQHEQAGPEFKVESAVKEEYGEWFAVIRIRQTGGAPLESAHVTVSGSDVRGLRQSKHDHEWLPQPVVWNMPAPDTIFDLCAELEFHHENPPIVRIALACSAADGRSWDRTLTAQPATPPSSREGSRRH